MFFLNHLQRAHLISLHSFFIHIFSIVSDADGDNEYSSLLKNVISNTKENCKMKNTQLISITLAA